MQTGGGPFCASAKQKESDRDSEAYTAREQPTAEGLPDGNAVPQIALTQGALQAE